MKDIREAELEQLRREIQDCGDCPLAHISPRIVFGLGDPCSPLAIVGEGPGEQEEIEGRPFVGRAGHLLDRLLASVGLRREDVWLTNVLKRRASRLVDGRVKNRLPRAGELTFYKRYLDREMRVVSPRIVLCLGNLAANALIHHNFRMTQEHGQWFTGACNCKLIATYHPAYILRLEGSGYHQVMRQAEDDFAAAALEYRALAAA